MITPTPKANYVPEVAIHTSTVLRNPKVRAPDGEIVREKELRSDDPYNEERISEKVPSEQSVKQSPPDDKVKPG